MLNPAHILEIALLLLVAFLVGATVGTLARLLALRLSRPKAAQAAVVESVAVADPVPSLVVAPVIDPVAKSEVPVATADIEAPDFSEAIRSLAGASGLASMSAIKMPSFAPLPAVTTPPPPAAMSPARVAGETTSGRKIAHPQVAASPPASVVEPGVSADVIPFPAAKPAIVATPEQPVVVEPQVIAAAEPVPETPLPASDQDAVPEVEVQKVEVAEASPTEPVIAAVAPIEDAVQVAPVAAPAAPPAPDAARTEDDEAAAMRAIEGNWSPRRAAPRKARQAVLPDGAAADDAVVASAAAVASAVQAANQAVADAPAEPLGKPAGLAAPRRDLKDELTNVIGILPIIETALNSLGIFHFDQVAELSEQNVDWLEAHLGIAGRIGREHWREQARELAAAMATSRKAASQQ